MSEDNLPSDRNRSRERARRLYWSHHNRDTYTCPDCGRDRDEIRNGFEVHHKDGDPSNNSLDNLVALCRPCHNLRERKKPSINDIEHLRDQLDAAGEDSNNSPVPIVTTRDEYIEAQERATEQLLPGLMINQITGAHGANVEFDFILAGGWKIIECQNGYSVGASPTLSEDAVHSCQRILDRYRNYVDKSSQYTMSIEYGQRFFTTPQLPPDVAKSLAYQLDPIVNDRSNWVLTKSSRNELQRPGSNIRLAEDLQDHDS